MNGERHLEVTMTYGGRNHPHRAHGYNRRRGFTGGTPQSFGVLGEDRELHNKVAKRKANAQRRRADRDAIQDFMSE